MTTLGQRDGSRPPRPESRHHRRATSPSHAAGSRHAAASSASRAGYAVRQLLVQRHALDGRGVRQLAELLARGRGEGQRQPSHMRREISQAELLAGSWAVELLVGHVHQYVGCAFTRRGQVDSCVY